MPVMPVALGNSSIGGQMNVWTVEVDGPLKQSYSLNVYLSTGIWSDKAMHTEYVHLIEKSGKGNYQPIALYWKYRKFPM